MSNPAQINQHSVYPRFVYHATLAPRIVNDKDAHEEMKAAGWKDSYILQHYPKFIYHESQKPKIVATKEEHEKHLALGWKNSAAEIGKKAEVARGTQGRETHNLIDLDETDRKGLGIAPAHAREVIEAAGAKGKKLKG